MTIYLLALIIAAMTLCSFGGGFSFGKFVETRDVLWLVGGYSLYSLSNLCFLLVIDQGGLVRALVIGSATNVLLTTVVSYLYFSEDIGLKGLVAVSLVIAAAFLVAPQTAPSSPQNTTKNLPKTVEV